MSICFVLELIIFVKIENTNDVCYFCLLFCFKNVCDDGEILVILIFMFDVFCFIVFYY